MNPDDLPIPAEMFAEGPPPFGDDDLDALFGLVDTIAKDAGTASAEALACLRRDDVDYAPAEAVRAARWRVEDDRAAAWAAARLAEAEAERRRLSDQAADWRARIDAWEQHATRRPARTAEHFRGLLEDYGLRVRSADPLRATITLPSATIRTTAKKEAVEVLDDAAVAAWLDLACDGDRGLKLRAALDEAGVTLDDLVQWRPKVYVGPLRKVTRPASRETDGVRATVILACAHDLSYVAADENAPDVPDRGDSVYCVDCGAAAFVEEVRFSALVERLAIGPDGDPVPGLAVRPPSTDVRVEVTL